MVEGSTSSKVPVNSGVPQGSILGPLLFILYNNEIASLPLTLNSTLTLYADDILFSTPFKNQSDVLAAQSNINKLSSWLQSNHLTINTFKTKYMIVTRKSDSFIASLPSLYLNDCSIEKVSPCKYLGIILTSKLSWSPHIQHICSKARKLLGCIFRHFYYLSTSSVLIKLYKSQVFPILTYCSSLWDPQFTKDKIAIEKVRFFCTENLCQKMVLKLLHSSWPFSNAISLLAMLHLENNIPLQNDLPQMFYTYVFSLLSSITVTYPSFFSSSQLKISIMPTQTLFSYNN